MGDLKHLDRQVDIWVLFAADAQSHTLLSYCESVLSDEEVDRAKRFVFPEHRRMFFLAHGFTRCVLSRYMGFPPRAWEFSVSPHGKPRIANAGASGMLAFNVSHTSRAVAVAVARPMQLGIDIEQVKGGIECEKLAQRFFSPQEVQDLLATPQADRAKAFVRIWTLKEAYVKARGEGLSIPLNRFAFSLRVPHTIGFAADAALDASPIEWRVCHADLPDHHLLALCAGRSALQTEARILRCVSVTSVPPPEGVLHVQDMVTLPLPQVTVPGHVT